MPQRIRFEGQVHVFPDDFTDADIAAALSDSPVSERQAGSSVGPAGVLAAEGVRRGVERVGLQVATSPNLSRVVNAASKPAAGMVARAVGVTGGLPGYVAGEA